jgi:hypothetical protein
VVTEVFHHSHSGSAALFFRKIFAALAIFAEMMERTRKEDGAMRTSSDPCARTQPRAAIGDNLAL